MHHRILKRNEYDPSNSLVDEGDDIVGDYTSLADIDASYFEIGEVNGVSPCLRVRIWFYNVELLDNLQLKVVGHYVGSPTHYMDVRVFNNTTALWDLIGRMDNDAADETYLFQIGGTLTDYVNAGNVAFMFNHIPEGTGNDNHVLYLDQALCETEEEIFLTGTAQPDNVVAGKTFYNTDPLTQLTGIYVAPSGVASRRTVVKHVVNPADETLLMATGVLLVRNRQLKRKLKVLEQNKV